jgi:vacuolar-type H+-ATPase subunit E/Vma4
MALAQLITRLEQEAQLRADAIRADGEEQLRAIDAATAEAAGEVVTAYLAQERVRRQAAHARALAIAQHEARARELEATRAQVARILDRAYELIDELAASPVYLSVLPAHVQEALSFLEGLRPRVRCRASLAAVVQPSVAQHTGATLVVDDAVAAGVVAEADDGSVLVDNTIKARLARREPDLATALARRLRDGGC